MTDVTTCYFRNLELTSSPEAAAILTLAHVIAGGSKTEPDGMLTVKQTADELGVSTWTVYGLAKCGKLPASRIGNGRGTLRFNPADVDAYKKDSAGFRVPARGYTTKLLPPR